METPRDHTFLIIARNLGMLLPYWLLPFVCSVTFLTLLRGHLRPHGEYLHDEEGFRLPYA